MTLTSTGTSVNWAGAFLLWDRVLILLSMARISSPKEVQRRKKIRHTEKAQCIEKPDEYQKKSNARENGTITDRATAIKGTQTHGQIIERSANVPCTITGYSRASRVKNNCARAVILTAISYLPKKLDWLSHHIRSTNASALFSDKKSNTTPSFNLSGGGERGKRREGEKVKEGKEKDKERK